MGYDTISKGKRKRRGRGLCISDREIENDNGKNFECAHQEKLSLLKKESELTKKGGLTMKKGMLL